MKKVSILLLLMYVSVSVFCQVNKLDLSGKWQSETPVVSSALLDHYVFDGDNNTFEFRTNEYNGLNRVIAIGGDFEIKTDSLLYTITYTLEYVGGFPIRSMTTTFSDSWELIEGELKRNEFVENTIIEKAILKKKFDKECGVEYLLIDDKVFYKIDSK